MWCDAEEPHPHRDIGDPCHCSNTYAYIMEWEKTPHILLFLNAGCQSLDNTPFNASSLLHLLLEMETLKN